MSYLCSNCPIRDNRNNLCDQCKPYCDKLDKMFEQHKEMLDSISESIDKF